MLNLSEAELHALGTALRGRVLVFTGAGISVASGLPTFRGAGGLYEGRNPYELATLQAFQETPVTVWNWYLMRIHAAREAQPNDAHHALAELENIAENVTIVTTNVDPLHQMAGSHNIYHLHGDILETKCLACGKIAPLDLKTLPESLTEDTLFRCDCTSLLRPNIVWFGEQPWPEGFEAVNRELPNATIVLEVGQSGTVTYGLTEHAVQFGIPVIRINPEPVEHPGILCLPAPAEDLLPALVALAYSV